jgi:integrase
MVQTDFDSATASATLTIPELEQSKAAVLNTLASAHSRRSYAYAIDRFIAWYCGEPRLTFNRAVVVRYRSHLESLSLSGATINLRLSAIRRLADEAAESGWLTPELAIGIRRVQGVKRLGRKSGNWLTRNQAQELVNAASKTDLRGWRDGAILGLLLGCGLRRSEVVGLTVDQLQTREGRWGFRKMGKPLTHLVNMPSFAICLRLSRRSGLGTAKVASSDLFSPCLCGFHSTSPPKPPINKLALVFVSRSSGAQKIESNSSPVR